jgi:hypothetical protein
MDRTKVLPPALPDHIFCMRAVEYYAVVNGRVFGPWPDRGAALAGLQTEQRRAAA